MTTQHYLLSALGMYLILLLSVGYYWMRRAKTSDQFLMAGRNLGLVVLIGTTLASMVGTGSTMGAAGLGFRGGWAASLYGVGGGIGMLLLGLLFTDVRKYRLMTMAEEIACYYGGNRILYNIASIFMFISCITWLGVHLMGGGYYLSFIVGIDFRVAIIIAGFGFIVYVILGGYLAVVWADLIQGVILFIGFLILTIVTLVKMGGLGALLDSVPPDFTSFFGIEVVGWKTVVSIPLAIAAGVLTTPTYRHRIFSGKDVSTVKKSFIITGILYICFSFFPAIIGMSARALNADIAAPDQALPWLAVNVFPVWFAALVIVAGLSATLSSADSGTFTGVVFFVRHIYTMIFRKLPSNPILISRITVSGMFLVALVIVMQFENIVDYITVMISVVLTGFVPVVILGKFWRTASWQGAVGAILSGSVVALLVQNIPAWKEFWQEPVLPALITSFSCAVIISLLTKTDKPSPGEIALLLAKERESIDAISPGELGLH